MESSKSGEAWQKIVREVNKAGPFKSIKQCKDKLRNLKQSYKDAKSNNKTTGRPPKRSPFFDELDEVLGSRPIITKPGVIEVGVNTSGELSSASTTFQELGDPESDESVDEKILSEKIIEMRSVQMKVLERAQGCTEDLVKLDAEQRRHDEEGRDQEFFLRFAEILKK